MKNYVSMDVHSASYRNLHFCFFFSGETVRMNLFQSLTSAMDIALEKDPTAGESGAGFMKLGFSTKKKSATRPLPWGSF